MEPGFRSEGSVRPMPNPGHYPNYPKEFTRGKLDAIPHDHQVSQIVVAYFAAGNGTVSASVTAGGPFFKEPHVYASDVTLKTLDPLETPPGHTPLKYWD